MPIKHNHCHQSKPSFRVAQACDAAQTILNHRTAEAKQQCVSASELAMYVKDMFLAVFAFYATTLDLSDIFPSRPTSGTDRWHP